MGRLAPMVAPHPKVFISTDAALLDMEWVCRAIKASYWGGWLKDDQIKAAVLHSFCFGLYQDLTKQIGLLRVVSDGAVFSSITDLLVEDGHQLRGYGSRLMEEALAHHSIKGTICVLRSRAALWAFYSKHGFVLLDPQHGLMQRNPR